MTTVDTGMRKTVGDFIKSGYEKQELNVTRKSGSYLIQAGGKQMMVTGDWYYAANGKTGKMEVVGGSFANGLDGNVLMYAKDREGNLHYSQVQGKMDQRGNLIAGRRTEITEDQFVQMSQQGAAVVSTRSGGGFTGSVHADGGVKADYSSSQVTGTRVESRQNLAGSAVSQEFSEGRSIYAGTAATTIAVGQGALHETAGLVGDVTTVTAPNRSMIKNREAKEAVKVKAEAATVRESARVMENRIQQQTQRTGKILQNQSRTSNLPKGPGPAPLKRGK